MKFVQIDHEAVVPISRILWLEYHTRNAVTVHLDGLPSMLVDSHRHVDHLEEQLGVEINEDWFVD